MRIGIIGAGAIGGTFAALLDAAGHEVVVTARGDHLDAIRTHGLRLEGAYGSHVARVGAAQILPRVDSRVREVLRRGDRDDCEQRSRMSTRGGRFRMKKC